MATQESLAVLDARRDHVYDFFMARLFGGESNGWVPLDLPMVPVDVRAMTRSSKDETEWKLTVHVNAPADVAFRALLNPVLTPAWLPFLVGMELVESFAVIDPSWVTLRGYNAPSSDGRNYAVDLSVWTIYSTPSEPRAAFFDAAPMYDYPLDPSLTRFYGHQMLRYVVPLSPSSCSVTFVGYWEHARYGFTGPNATEQARGVVALLTAGLQKLGLLAEFLHKSYTGPLGTWPNDPTATKPTCFNNICYVPEDMVFAVHTHPQLGPIPRYSPTMERLLSDSHPRTVGPVPPLAPAPVANKHKLHSTSRMSLLAADQGATTSTHTPTPTSTSTVSSLGPMVPGSSGIATRSDAISGPPNASSGVAQGSATSAQNLSELSHKSSRLLPPGIKTTRPLAPSFSGAGGAPASAFPNPSPSAPDSSSLFSTPLNKASFGFPAVAAVSSVGNSADNTAALVSSEAQAALDSSEQALLVVNLAPSLDIVSANTAVASLLGHRPGWLMGRALSSLQSSFVGEEALDMLLQPLVPSSSGGSGSGPTLNLCEGFTRLSHLSGHTIWLYVRARIVPVDLMNSRVAAAGGKSVSVDMAGMPSSIVPAFLEQDGAVVLVQLQDLSPLLGRIDAMAQNPANVIPVVPTFSLVGGPRDGVIVSVDESFTREFGWRTQDVAGKPHLGLWPRPEACRTLSAALTSFSQSNASCFVSTQSILLTSGRIAPVLAIMYKDPPPSALPSDTLTVCVPLSLVSSLLAAPASS